MRIIAIYLIVILPSIVSAQNLYSGTTLKLGEPYPVEDNEIENFIVDYDSTFIYGIKIDKQKAIIQKFDIKTLEQVAKYENDVLPKRFEYQRLIRSDKKLYILYESKPRWEPNLIYIREIDQDNLKLGRQIELFMVEEDVKENEYYPDYSISTSFDKSKILVSYQKDVKNNERPVYGFYVFNSKFEKVWGREFEIPYTQDILSGLSYQLEDDGSLLMILNVNNQCKLLTINDDSYDEKAIDLNRNLFITQFAFNKKDNGNFLITGYYGKPAFSDEIGNIINGVVIFELDHNQDLVKDNYSAFPEKLVSNVIVGGDSVKTLENGLEVGINGLQLANVVLDKHNNVTVLGEVNYVKHEYDLGAYKNLNHSKDIVVTKLSNDGDLLWWTNINKHQIGSFYNIHSINNVSFLYDQGKGKHFIIYADHIDNANISDSDDKVSIHRGGAGGFITLVSIDDVTGKKKKHILFDAKDVNGTAAYQFHFPNILVFKNNTYITEVYIKKKRDALLKFHVDFD